MCRVRNVWMLALAGFVMATSSAWCGAQSTDFIEGTWRIDWELTKKALEEHGSSENEIMAIGEMAPSLRLVFGADGKFNFVGGDNFSREGKFKLVSTDDAEVFRLELTFADSDGTDVGDVHLLETDVIRIQPENDSPAVLRRLVNEDEATAAWSKFLQGKWKSDLEQTRTLGKQKGMDDDDIEALLRDVGDVTLTIKDAGSMVFAHQSQDGSHDMDGEWSVASVADKPDAFTMDVKLAESPESIHFQGVKRGADRIELTDGERGTVVFTRVK